MVSPLSPLISFIGVRISSLLTNLLLDPQSHKSGSKVNNLLGFVGIRITMHGCNAVILTKKRKEEVQDIVFCIFTFRMGRS